MCLSNIKISFVSFLDGSEWVNEILMLEAAEI
jgi:hypothetical protein